MDLQVRQWTLDTRHIGVRAKLWGLHQTLRVFKNKEIDPHDMVLLPLPVPKGKILSYTLLGFCTQLLKSVFLQGMIKDLIGDNRVFITMEMKPRYLEKSIFMGD